jgi:2-aminoadipate transaminase
VIVRFSKDSGALRPSAIRRFASLLQDPSYFSFAGGAPNPLTFPSEALAEAAREAILTHRDVALQYGPTAGLPELRRATAQILYARGVVSSHPDRIVITTGSQQGLDLLARVLVDPGDVVAVESPAYVGGLAAFAARRAQFLAARRDADRLDVEELARKVRRARSEGRRVSVLYTIPNFQNPSGWTLSLAARRELLSAAAELDLLVLEDDPYAEIHFGEPPPAPLAALDQEGRVVHLGSFSKTLSAGLRCGFLLGAEEIVRKVELTKQAADLCSSMLDQSTLAIYLARNDYAAHLVGVRKFYAEQKAIFLTALREECPATVETSEPAGGLFTWGALPAGLDAEMLLDRLLAEEKVAYVPGRSFFVDENPDNGRWFRLTFAKEPPDRLEEGARRLGRFLARVAA